MFLNPHTSLREISRDSGISYSTVQTIAKKNKYHDFHITITQALTPNDMRIRIEFCQWSLARIQEDPRFLGM